MLRILHLTTRLRREPPLKGKPFVKFAPIGYIHAPLRMTRARLVYKKTAGASPRPTVKLIILCFLRLFYLNLFGILLIRRLTPTPSLTREGSHMLIFQQQF